MKSDWPASLPHRIDQIAQQNPNKTALIDGIGSDLTYADMINRIESIAEQLQNAGLGNGSRVLVFEQAASDWVCSMLAIMRIGGIYVPLDLRNPLPRLAAVAVSCEPSAILADDTTVGDVAQLNVAYAHVINVSTVPRQASKHIDNVAQATSTAAILYTSGSTGTPKGIEVTHAGLRNEIEGYTKTWKLGAERTLQQSAFTFNHSSDQIYTGLVNGGTVCIVPWSKRGDPIEVTKLIKQHAITYTKATPSEYLMWMQYGGDNLREAFSWRSAFGGGEPMTSIVTQEFANLGLSQLHLYNSYGPTEISISSTKMELEYRDQKAMEDGRIPCGFSLPNYYTYVVDEQLKPVPAGMPGEICLGGAGVSKGYLNNPKLTAQHFVTNPFATAEDVSNGWTRMYRTGDIGHLQDDGAMVFHSRMAGDTQIKIRGLRIELDDIESNIVSAAEGALREAVVTLREGNPDFLVAHVAFAPKHQVTDKEAFLEHLLAHLPIPQYMIPVLAIPIDKFPLTNHSKVDRKAVKNLPLPQRTKNSQDDEELSETMVQLKRVWLDVLGNAHLGLDIGPSTSFFLVGGNSLLAIRLQARIRQIFSVTVRLVDILGNNTLGKMARKIEESTSVALIDWVKETVPPTIPSFLKGVVSQAQPKTKKTVLVTGSTGFIAKYILPQLANDANIEKIHAVAVRDQTTERAQKIAALDKVVIHKGDLSAPLLGLTEESFRTLSSEVDVILHMGAVRSFWDNYNVLRPSNVQATKELVTLAAPRHVPIHYISTVGVLPQDTTEAVSAATNAPAVDGSNGYVASRWASERILERSSEELGVPTSIYRFLPASQKLSPVEVLDSFVGFVDKLGLFPDTENWEGRIDMAPADQAADWISKPLFEEHVSGVRISHFESPIAIDVAEMRTYLEKKRGDQKLERMPGLRWIGRIKAEGWNYFLTSQQATVGSSTGGFESRR